MADIQPLGVGHVVLKVREMTRSTKFYQDVLGFKKVGEIAGRMVFFTATGDNHHDLALMAVGPGAATPPPAAVGLYHVAIKLASEEDVKKAYRALVAANAEVVGASDHGVSRSLYLKDPDGIELELYADVPGWQELGAEVATIRPWDPR